MLFHMNMAVELETHPLLLIRAEVPCQCTIRAKHLRSLGLKALVLTATTTQLFISIQLANIPSPCIFCYSTPHSFSLPTVSSSSSLPYSSQWPQIPHIFLLVQPEASFHSLSPSVLQSLPYSSLSYQPAIIPHILHLLSRGKVSMTKIP